ncbi:MAG: phosphotransferase [Methylophagaceae bacterium]
MNYPKLSLAQQQKLPELIQVNALPMMFDDSTHQLWRCETAQGPLILKVCNRNNVVQSTFWQGMKSLFDVDIPNQLAQFEQVFQIVTSLSSLAIPDYIASDSQSHKQIPSILRSSKDEDINHGSPFDRLRVNGRSPAFIAVQELSGVMVEADAVNDKMVVSLADHLAKLHQATQSTWGRIGHTNFDVQQWLLRLKGTLKLLADRQEVAIPDELLNEAIEQAENCTTEEFVLIMPDLRWDQFLQQDGKLIALVDLDAFVFGPRELELVLLEYLLTEQQAKVFATHYQQIHSLPDLSQVRKPYRLLLFLMNVLGETDLDVWMQSPTRW